MHDDTGACALIRSNVVFGLCHPDRTGQAFVLVFQYIYLYVPELIYTLEKPVCMHTCV